MYFCVLRVLWQAYPSDEKSMAKTQTIVLRHLYLLLGYNQNERGFYVPPYRLRYEHMVTAVLPVCAIYASHYEGVWQNGGTALCILKTRY
jgi:hypothetical protein